MRHQHESFRGSLPRSRSKDVVHRCSPRRAIGPRLALWLALTAAGCGVAPLDAIAIDPSGIRLDLVAHWSFDDKQGATARDDSGHGYHGALTGGTWLPTGRFGGALQLAVGDFVSVESFPDATTDWTVSTWTRSSFAQLSATTDAETIISTERVFAGGWQLHLDNRPGFNRFDAAYWTGPDDEDYVVAVCTCVEPDRWIHTVAVFDGTARQLTLYRNGAIADRVSMRTPILPGDATLLIGTWNMRNRFLAADIDDFAIWRRVLQPSEVALLAQQPPGP